MQPEDEWVAMGLANGKRLSIQQRQEPGPSKAERRKRPTGLTQGDYAQGQPAVRLHFLLHHCG